ncbi:MAG: DUF6516 family protein [Candidatus Scalindua sp.]|nr:DUF6516 family protein [Candidatus Scalindua sp.]
MILSLYKDLKKLADKEYDDIIDNSEIIYSYTGRARKLRLKLIDSTFVDIFYSEENNYSLHWEQRNMRNTIYRHDNASPLIRNGLKLRLSKT